MKINVIIEFYMTAAITLIAVGCAKVSEVECGGKLHKMIEISQGSQTDGEVKSIVSVETGAVVWSGSTGSPDKLYYYTFGDGATVQAVASVSVTSSGTTIRAEIDYDDDDNQMVLMTKGAKVGGYGDCNKTSVTVEKAVPNNQTGNVNDCYLSMVKEKLESSSASLKPMQTYISFSLSSLTVGDKTVKEISLASDSEICVNDSETGTGDVSYALDGSYSSHTRGLKEITMTAAPAVNTTYYLAVLPGTYSNLTFKFKDGAGTILGYAKTGSVTVEQGHIKPFGVLSPYKDVYTTSLEIYPTSAHIVNLDDCCLTKKLYVKSTPSDLTQLKWKSSDDDIATVTDMGKETIEGVEYRVGLVTPVWESKSDMLTEKECTISAYSDLVPESERVDGVNQISSTVTVGMFVDLGLSTLWCATNVKGSKGTDLGLEKKVTEYGDLYMWGYTTKSTKPTSTMTWLTYWSNWPADERGTATGYSLQYGNKGGGKYSTEEKRFLDENDDVGKVMNNDGGWRMFTAAELAALKSDCTVSQTGQVAGVNGVMITPKNFPYQDVYIFLPFAGAWNEWGFNGCEGSGAYYISGEAGTTNFQSWAGRHAYVCTDSSGKPWSPGPNPVAYSWAYCYFSDVLYQQLGILFTAGSIRIVKPKP